MGSVLEFYKAKKIDYTMGLLLFLSIVIGGIFGAKLVVNEKYKLSKKTIKYITSALGFVIFVSF
jgi:uncharacterized membrane protein YfcA